MRKTVPGHLDVVMVALPVFDSIHSEIDGVGPSQLRLWPLTLEEMRYLSQAAFDGKMADLLIVPRAPRRLDPFEPIAQHGEFLLCRFEAPRGMFSLTNQGHGVDDLQPHGIAIFGVPAGFGRKVAPFEHAAFDRPRQDVGRYIASTLCCHVVWTYSDFTPFPVSSASPWRMTNPTEGSLTVPFDPREVLDGCRTD
ncbi:hypothetical protein PG994_009180 [Apiospora phragmitis]|uniref:Uncharacterized protein n=1 Tax=Apiospora phragmitis TaxID=2905665 RepID=A0ABR1UJ36_9PEZI